MRRVHLFKSKLHRATVTEADLDYEGSISIDRELMEAADIFPYEKVAVWNVTNGSRIETYAIRGEKGTICVNGAAAHHFSPGDRVIIATWCDVPEAEARAHEPVVVLLNEDNTIKERNVVEVPGPARRPTLVGKRPDEDLAV